MFILNILSCYSGNELPISENFNCTAFTVYEMTTDEQTGRDQSLVIPINSLRFYPSDTKTIRRQTYFQI